MSDRKYKGLSDREDTFVSECQHGVDCGQAFTSNQVERLLAVVDGLREEYARHALFVATPVIDHYKIELAALVSTFVGVMAAHGVTGISLTYGQEHSSWCRPELLEDSFKRDLDEGRAKLKEGKVSS